jgi:hypothetical protein
VATAIASFFTAAIEATADNDPDNDNDDPEHPILFEKFIAELVAQVGTGVDRRVNFSHLHFGCNLPGKIIGLQFSVARWYIFKPKMSIL